MDLNIASIEDANLLVGTNATNVTTGGNSSISSWPAD